MNKSEIILKIEKPCSEEWHSMSTINEGKFCSNCSQSVTDFTHLTDTELLEQIYKSSGRICGRLRQDQLSRTIGTIQSKKQLPWYKLLTGLFLLHGFNPLSAANRYDLTEKGINMHTWFNGEKRKKEEEKTKKSNDSKSNIIQGKILDAVTKAPIGFVSIILRDTKTGTTGDAEGNFRFVVPDSLLKDKFYIDFYSLGYKKMEVSIHRNNLPINIQVIIQPDEQELLGEIIIVKKKKWWQRRKKG